MPANAAMHCARDPWRHRPHTRRAAEPSAAYLRKSALCAVCDGAEPPMPLITGSKLKWRIWRGLRSAPGVSLSVRTSSISVSRAGEERAAADCGRFAGSARGRCWATRPVPSASASSPMCASQGELKIIFSSPCLSSAVAPVVAVGRWVRRGGAVLERLRPLGSGAWASAAACSPLTLLCRLRLVSLDGDTQCKLQRGGQGGAGWRAHRSRVRVQQCIVESDAPAAQQLLRLGEGRENIPLARAGHVLLAHRGRGTQ
mmetsp:Transcript_45097/g.111815  ORF Transcript_45097/g.111815 Transcript_45097/m.111815 type:complete len:257 (+) Transcript_45097:101-871(+)